MKVRSGTFRPGRIRALAALPLLVMAGAGLSACDTKVGTAAVINGHKITESDLNSYLTSSVQPVPGNNGSVPARFFALSILVNREIGPNLVAAAGEKPTPAQEAQARKAISDSATTNGIEGQLSKLGFAPKFYQAYLDEQTQVSLLGAKVTSAQQLAGVVKKAGLNVSVNPRYGGWDARTLSLTEVGKKQLPNALTLGTTLPGDATASPTP
ncbi:hypothetical protein M6D93_05080 [Jatrophihabitans telluris]|uniref:Lipoprotein n=1 Tax=Jatrophihabitans telluris TaxID=2038343 RepID=A0ABY4R2X5_9ACTN|nr:hypothetical protein [Jatrophihabitans telluris]UQX89379.1 hypothetical protein M6D93_05080 [Jatrophihabitans telluris]